MTSRILKSPLVVGGNRRLLFRHGVDESRRWLWLRRPQENPATTRRHGSAAFSSTTTATAGSSSSSSNRRIDDPGKLVAGLTPEDVASNPEIEAYLRSNFGDGWDTDATRNDDDHDDRDDDASGFATTSGISIPAEVFEKFGIDADDIAASPAEKKMKRRSRGSGGRAADAGLGNAEQDALNIRVLRSRARSPEESTVRLRRNGMIPGILYGSDPTLGILSTDPSSKTLLQTPWPDLQRELDRYHRRFESRVYDLTVFESDDDDDAEGEVHRVVPSDVQRHPVKGTIYCANFLRYHAGRPLKIPLTYVNEEESAALKRDGFIIPVRKFVECIVEDGVPIPDAVEVECTGLQVKDIIRMDRLIFPDGVRPVDTLDLDTFVVGPVRGGKSAGEDDDGNDDAAEANEE
mmetsp:Transcript_26383/g.61977  ORF Transcript_26383/g.61977 Transcript_26383/m.61977 type:complete len:405 (+) Transcript_26383:80-1294(+)